MSLSTALRNRIYNEFPCLFCFKRKARPSRIYVRFLSCILPVMKLSKYFRIMGSYFGIPFSILES